MSKAELIQKANEAIARWKNPTLPKMNELKLLPPLLKWAGGKYRQKIITSKVRELFEPYRDTYHWIEPFCGGLGMTHAVSPYTASLNDINEELIDFYDFINYCDFTEFCAWCDRIGYLFWQSLGGSSEERYHNAKKIFNNKDHYKNLKWHERASLFYGLNKTCFNGLFRTNSKGKMNTPIGRKSKKKGQEKGDPYQPNYRLSLDYIKLFYQWNFSSLEWEAFMDCMMNGLLKSEQFFVYADPPYAETFDRYSSGCFSWEQQERLATYLSKLNCPVVASNLHTPKVRELYESLGFESMAIAVDHSMKAKARNKVQEGLYWKGI